MREGENRPSQCLPLELEKRDDGWWVKDPNNIDMGPYRTKEDAEEDRRGVTRFWKNNPEYL